MLKLYNASAKDYYFFEDELSKRIRDKRSDFIALLPVNRAVRLLKRRLTDCAPLNTIIDANIFTFNEILLKIYSILSDSKRVIQSETQRLFISQILRNYKTSFHYFPVNPSIPESSVVKIADIVAELRRFGYSKDKFKDVKLESSVKQADFYLLLTHFEELLYPNLIDEPFALFTSAEKMDRDLFVKLFPQVKDIYISGYELFTPAMFSFMESTKEWINIHIKLTYNKNNSASFNHVHDAWHIIEQMADEIAIEKNATPLSYHLLNHESKAIFKNGDLDTQYFVHKLKNRKEEIEFIAALARQLTIRDKIPLHRIAVTFANLERYVSLIRTVFNEHQLPYNLSTGFKLNQSPLIQLFLNVLKWIISGYDSTKALELINNQFIEIENRTGIGVIFKQIARYRIQYLSPFALRKFKEKLQQRGYDSNLIELIEQLSGLLKPFYDFPKNGTITQLRNAYIGLLKNIGLLDWYKAETIHLSEQDREKEFRAYNRFMKLFDKFVWSLNRIGETETLSLKDFIRLLQSQVNNASYSLGEKTDYGVQINPRLEIQAQSYDVLIIGGLLDGEFPRESVKDVFFNDSIRKNIGLIATENLFDQDRFIFYSLVDSHAQRIYLTYPEYEQDRILPPSTFLADFTEIYPDLQNDPSFNSGYLNTASYYWLRFGETILQQKDDEAQIIMETLVNAGGDDVKKILQDTLHRIGVHKFRFGGTEISPYEGGMAGNSSIANLLRKKFSNIVWSASRLEEYAFCPMRFFYNRILKIEEWPKIEEEFTPLERGNLLHTILFRFYTEITDKNKPLHYKNRLMEIAHEELERLPYSGFFAQLEKIRYCGNGVTEGFLGYFVDYDQGQIAESQYSPAYFEISFGMANKKNCDISSVTEPLILEDDGKILKLQGKIDRVDVNPNGSALIFDYKTGTSAQKIKPQDIVNGLSFQIPLYMEILPQLIKKYSADYGGYYIIKDKDACERHALIADSQSAPPGKPKKNFLPNKKFLNEQEEEYLLDEVLKIAVKEAIKCTEDVVKGVFRHTLFPDNAACKDYCDFRKMCQKNPAKMKRIAEEMVIS
jgi:ATP-dependent helicase/DNAse subunit B